MDYLALVGNWSRQHESNVAGERTVMLQIPFIRKYLELSLNGEGGNRGPNNLRQCYVTYSRIELLKVG